MSETQDKVSKISQETIGKLKARSVFGLSKNPTEKGASPEKIKDAIAGVVVGNNNSLLYEINRIADETNDEFNTQADDIESLDTLVTSHSTTLNHMSTGNVIVNTAKNYDSSSGTIKDGFAQLNTDVDEIGNAMQVNSQNITKIVNGTTEVANANTCKNYDETANSGNIKTTFDSINSTLPNKLDKVFNNIGQANDLGDNDYFIINSGSVAYRVPFSKLRGKLGDGSINHYKGDYLSLTALQSANSTGTSGDYAFVNTDDVMIMYVWDNTESKWEATNTGRYALTTTVATLQNNLSNGTYVVNKAENYSETGGIKTEFDSIKTRLNDLEYVPVEITSFTCTPNISELGTTTTTITFNWNFKGTPTSATIGTATISTPATTKTYSLSNQSITANTTFTLTLKDSRGRTVSKTCTLTFANRIYWGVAAIPSSYTTTFIKGLTSNALTTNSARTITLTLGSGQYGYFCVPATWKPIFKVGGFDGGFEDGQQIIFNATNSYYPSYKIWRTTNANLGTITIEIKEGN